MFGDMYLFNLFSKGISDMDVYRIDRWLRLYERILYIFSLKATCHLLLKLKRNLYKISENTIHLQNQVDFFFFIVPVKRGTSLNL